MTFKRLLLVSLILSAPVYAADLERELMPDRVYEGLKEAISAHYAKTPDSEELRLNLEGLDALRSKMRFLKMDRLEFLQISHWKDASLTAFFWGKRLEDGGCVLLRDDMVEGRPGANRIANVRTFDFKEELKKNLPALKDCLKSLPTARRGLAYFLEHEKIPLLRNDRETIAWSVAAVCEPDMGLLLFQYAYASVYFEEREAAQIFIDMLLKCYPFFLYSDAKYQYDYYERCAGKTMGRGMILLTNRGTFRDVYEQWSAAKRVFDKSEQVEKLDELLEDLKPQALAEMDPTRPKNVDPTALPLEGKIEFYIDRLQETHEAPMSHPPSYSFTSQCGPLIKIGTPAVSALIEHLDDRRLTRTVHDYGFHASPGSLGPIYRVGRVAAACIRRILDFDPLVDTVLSLSPNSVDAATKNKKNMKEWWESCKNKSQVDWYIGKLASTSTRNRIVLLDKIERLDPKAVDSIALLKEWGEGINEESERRRKEELKKRLDADPKMTPMMRGIYLNGPGTGYTEDLAAIANALAARGDFSILPRIREELQKLIDGKGRAYPYTWYLTKYGDVDDYIFMYRAVRKEMEEGFVPGSSKIVGPVFSSVQSATHPLTVPILVLFLDCNKECGAGSNWGGDGRMTYADRAMENLIKRTEHNEGFNQSDLMSVRRRAIDRWQQWWKREGIRLYAERHPEMNRFESKGES